MSNAEAHNAALALCPAGHTIASMDETSEGGLRNAGVVAVWSACGPKGGRRVGGYIFANGSACIVWGL